MFDLTISDTGLWLPIILLGILVHVAGNWYALVARRTWNWSVADAAITAVSGLNLKSQTRARTTRWDISVNVRINYAYLANDTLWKKEHVAQWRSTRQSSFDRAKIFLGNNPAGKRFQILYDPKNPSDSLVNGPRDPSLGFMASLLGLTVAIFGFANWLADPAMVIQIGIFLAGLATAVVVRYRFEYPFERPKWFEKSEDETAKFLEESESMKSAYSINRIRA